MLLGLPPAGVSPNAAIAAHAEVNPTIVLALLGLLTIVVLLVAIISKKMSPLVALIAVPTVAALVGGFGITTGKFIVHGIKDVAPVVGMFVFAILFFGVMTDAGLLDPIIARILRRVGTHPPRIVMATALLALLVHLDGSGAVTFLITVPAMLPLYERLGMDRRVLACAAAMAAGVNFLPWTGPTIRASAALKLSPTALFKPLIPVQAVGLLYVFAAAYWLGRREENRLRLAGTLGAEHHAPRRLAEEEKRLRRPGRFWVNLALTLLLVAAMVSGKAEPVVIFMVGVVLALLINYPHADEQRARVDAHARPALLMASILLAAGAFTGILKDSGMLGAMAQAAAAHLPARLAGHLPLLLALAAMPLSLLFDPDSFYFGVLPVVAAVAAAHGVSQPQVAQAALLGMHTTGFPVSPLTPSPYLLVGMAGIELGDHQRFTIPFLFGATLVMALAAILLGILPA
jgi:CitMHS family citrate-Mg2+:H+ or citrate-Ca2+:H+ symporter